MLQLVVPDDVTARHHAGGRVRSADALRVEVGALGGEGRVVVRIVACVHQSDAVLTPGLCATPAAKDRRKAAGATSLWCIGRGTSIVGRCFAEMCHGGTNKSNDGSRGNDCSCSNCPVWNGGMTGGLPLVSRRRRFIGGCVEGRELSRESNDVVGG